MKKISCADLVSQTDSYSVLHSTGPGMLQSLTSGVWQNSTVSLCATLLYSMKQFFWKFSSHSSSCWGSKSVVYVVWHFCE